MQNADFDLDLLMDMAISGAEIEDGISPERVAFHSNLNPAIFSGLERRRDAKEPQWSPEELDYLANNSGKQTIEEIAEFLGRSVLAVTIKQTRKKIKRVSTAKQCYITANQASIMLGIDGHKVAHWFDVGFIRGRIQPGEHQIRLVLKVALFAWACNTDNWIYFDPNKVQDAHLRRLIELKKARWGDEWWTTKQVAAYHGVETSFVNSYIDAKRISARQIKYSLGGRHTKMGWANWFVLKSVATDPGLIFYRHNNPRPAVTKRGMAWIVYARDVLKMPWHQIGARMGRTWKRCRATGKGITGTTVMKYYNIAKGEINAKTE
jgi:hypothetical protein